MSINKQLSKFYVDQGLTGKHLRSALKHDRRLVRKAIQQEGWYFKYPTSLFSAFNWSAQPSIPGIRDMGRYWCRRDVSSFW